MMLPAYRALTALVAPLLPLYLRRRQRRGKEDAERLPERLGHASLPRPEGALLWLHAASVGEANAVLPLIEVLEKNYPSLSLLLTTGTVTSAALMKKRLPSRVMHQFAPVDTPGAVSRFLRHWRPDIGVWVESELWPNLVTQAKAQGCALALVNARMSEKSFTRWQRFPSLIQAMLECFNTVYAQSEEDVVRYRALGASRVACLGNLKYDAALPPAHAGEVEELARKIAGRVAWIAASIHPGEDAAVAEAHGRLKEKFPRLLTLVVPRHPHRAAEMRLCFESQALRVAQRSLGDAIVAETDIYLADTLGELGLFYTLQIPVFIGGSLVPRGGQNPLEAARLACPLLNGPHMSNFFTITRELQESGGMAEIADSSALAKKLAHLFVCAENAAQMGARARACAERHAGVTQRLTERLAPLIREALAHARA